jgi:hypothetical protein
VLLAGYAARAVRHPHRVLDLPLLRRRAGALGIGLIAALFTTQPRALRPVPVLHATGLLLTATAALATATVTLVPGRPRQHRRGQRLKSAMPLRYIRHVNVRRTAGLTRLGPSPAERVLARGADRCPAVAKPKRVNS